MYNQLLADKIVEYLNSAFPDKVQFDHLKVALPEFSSVPEEEWLRVLEGLQSDGRVEFKALRTGFQERLAAVANIVISNSERRALASMGAKTSITPLLTPNEAEKAKHVWVVHGRDSQRRSAMFTFLFALGLKPISFGKARELTGVPMPQTSQIITAAFQNAQAVIVLLTPDDEGRLRQEFVKEDDEPSDTNLTPQPRLNVIFEAGMAVVSHPEQTIFVRFEYVRPFSDVAGLNYVFMDDTAERRRELAFRLKAAGCPVNLDDDDHWLHAGDFVSVKNAAAQPRAVGPLKNEIDASVASLKLEWESQKKLRPIRLGPLWAIVNRACPILLDLHTKALSQGASETAARLAEGYQVLKKYEGAADTATLDFDDLKFIQEVDDAIARLKPAT